MASGGSGRQRRLGVVGAAMQVMKVPTASTPDPPYFSTASTPDPSYFYYPTLEIVIDLPPATHPNLSGVKILDAMMDPRSHVGGATGTGFHVNRCREPGFTPVPLTLVHLLLFHHCLIDGSLQTIRVPSASTRTSSLKIRCESEQTLSVQR